MPGTVVATQYALGAVRRVEFACAADAADATFPDTVIPKLEGRLVELITNPGAVGPTDNYDITLEDADGADRLQGGGLNRDITLTEQVAAVFTGTALHPWVDGDEVLTLKIANNAVNAATVKVVLVYLPD